MRNAEVVKAETPLPEENRNATEAPDVLNGAPMILDRATDIALRRVAEGLLKELETVNPAEELERYRSETQGE